MKNYFTVESLGFGYEHICKSVLKHGREVAPRGLVTRELPAATIVCHNPRDSLPTGVGRKLNAAVGVAEALQLIGGFSRPDLMKVISPNFAQFLDDGHFHGAYGPRVRPQLEDVVRKLKSDADSRQAIVTIWDPAKDNELGLHDYPCTLSLHFMLRNDRLELHVTMRSNDVWWGLAYDAFQFTQLQCTLAHVLDVEPGAYAHHANSLHVYERDFDDIESLSNDARVADRWDGVGAPGMDVDTCMKRAAYIVNCAGPPHEPTATEERMFDKLDMYVSSESSS
jgi:thymidylate synthase